MENRTIENRTNGTNGRVDILSPDTNILFSMKDRIPSKSQTDFRGAMKGNWYNTIFTCSVCIFLLS